MRGGWISSAGTVEREGKRFRGVLWTEEGLQLSVALAMLLQEMEAKGGRFTDAELLCLRRLIRDHAP